MEANLSKAAVDSRLHWLRQGIGLLLGLVAGGVPVEGAAGLISYLLVAGAAGLVYTALVLKIQDPEEYGGQGALLACGLPSGAALFLVSITIVSVAAKLTVVFAAADVDMHLQPFACSSCLRCWHLFVLVDFTFTPTNYDRTRVSTAASNIGMSSSASVLAQTWGESDGMRTSFIPS
jgi:hypothetical protein